MRNHCLSRERPRLTSSYNYASPVLLMLFRIMLVRGFRQYSISKEGVPYFARNTKFNDVQHRMLFRRRRDCCVCSCAGTDVGGDDPLGESLDDLMNEVDSLLTELPNQADTNRRWRTIDWDAVSSRKSSSSFPTDSLAVFKKQDLRPTRCGDRPSPVEQVWIRDRLIYVKRDDLLRLTGSNVSGNKARKFFALNELTAEDFPGCVVSYGGPQSNAMLALAAIVHSKNVQLKLVPSIGTTEMIDSPVVDEIDELNVFETEASMTTSSLATNGPVELSERNLIAPSNVQPKRFVYYTKRLPRFLRNRPNGNLFRAQTLGMEIVELSNEEYSTLFGSESGGRPEAPSDLEPPISGDSLWVPQGGACGVAVSGGRMLAEEIVSFWAMHGCGKPLSVCVPGGSCTTALLLHREVREILVNRGLETLNIRVVVIPCVGDDAYARRQMIALSVDTGGGSKDADIPTILRPSPDAGHTRMSRRRPMGYFNFAEPDPEILRTFRELEKQYDMTVDLLYGAPTWTLLLQHWRTEKLPSSQFDAQNPLAGQEIMYCHSGGLEGINSQMTRYKYKGLVNMEDIQLPTKRSARCGKTTYVGSKVSSDTRNLFRICGFEISLSNSSVGTCQWRRGFVGVALDRRIFSQWLKQWLLSSKIATTMASTISASSYFTSYTPGKAAFYFVAVCYVVGVSIVACLEAFVVHECDESFTVEFGNPIYNENKCRHARMAILLFLTPDECSFARRLVMSVILGSVIGWERREADRPAGIRTMSLVSLGACLFTIDSTFAFLDGPMTWDASRISAAIPSGVGFLGAGLIFKESEKDDLTGESNHVVHGLTTATSVWLSAAVGVACGGELYFPALFGIALSLAMLRFGPRAESTDIADLFAAMGDVEVGGYGGTQKSASNITNEEDPDDIEEKRSLLKNIMTERRLSVRKRAQLGGSM